MPRRLWLPSGLDERVGSWTADFIGAVSNGGCHQGDGVRVCSQASLPQSRWAAALAEAGLGFHSEAYSWCVVFGRSQVRELLSSQGMHPRRSLGQNFVVDANTTRRIAQLAGVGPADHVVEIGPGLGALTQALLETGAAVTAVERDPRLIDVLKAELEGSAVTLVKGDAMHLDWNGLLGQEQWVMVSNLPYNVATPLVVGILEEVHQVKRMLVMVQREVGERMVATAGGQAYGAVSVKVAYFANAKIARRVARTVFVPQPKVDSVLVDIHRRDRPGLEPAMVSYEELCKVLRAGFAHRRKMLRRSLAAMAGPEVFAKAGISGEARAEELDLAAWGRLAAACTSDLLNPEPGRSR